MLEEGKEFQAENKKVRVQAGPGQHLQRGEEVSTASKGTDGSLILF